MLLSSREVFAGVVIGRYNFNAKEQPAESDYNENQDEYQGNSMVGFHNVLLFLVFGVAVVYASRWCIHWRWL